MAVWELVRCDSELLEASTDRRKKLICEKLSQQSNQSAAVSGWHCNYWSFVSLVAMHSRCHLPGNATTATFFIRILTH